MERAKRNNLRNTKGITHKLSRSSNGDDNNIFIAGHDSAMGCVNLLNKPGSEPNACKAQDSGTMLMAQ